MAPTTKSAPSKQSKSKAGGTSSSSKPRVTKSKSKAPPPKQQKTKSARHGPLKKKARVYSDKELGIPKLNMITPAGVQKPKGKKKGKVFVDDRESMMTILAMVNADKEGQIEGKMMKARQMEEIREARRQEAEVRQEQKRSKLEETKDSFRKKRNKRGSHDAQNTTPSSTQRKKVAFA